MRPRIIAVALLVIALGSVLGIELLLQLASALVPSISRVTGKPSIEKALIPDPRLGEKGNPSYPEHDARGFRNLMALDSADVVALGDSHTYGTSVQSDDAWPSQLSAALARPVYNMGLPGYGPVQAEENLGAALALHPSLVVFALYFGNDFYDAFWFAKKHGRLAAFVQAPVLARIDTLEQSKTIEAEIGFLFAQTSGGGGAGDSPEPSTIRSFLSDHSRLWGLLRAVKNQVAANTRSTLLTPDFDQARMALTPAQMPLVSVFESPDWKTIFTSPYRLRVEDDRDPRIRAGLDISKREIAAMSHRVAAASSRFVVLLLPTKEYVFWPKVGEPSRHTDLATIVRIEDRLREELTAFMKKSGIDYIDPAPTLRQSAAQPYFVNADGHPNRLGHQLIAGSVQRYMMASTSLGSNPERRSIGAGHQ